MCELTNTKDIKCVLLVNYDLHPQAGAAGNKWNDRTACFIFTGNCFYAEQAAGDKVREIANHPRTRKINSYNIFLNTNDGEIPVFNVVD